MMANNGFITKLATAAAAGAAAVTAYAFVVRPWHLRWGATDQECREPLPGDEILPSPDHEATHAITINVPVSDVWPWLAQIGQTRGGFYSYSWLENLIGCDMHNADRIVPEWQTLRAGDVVWLHPEVPPVPVILVEPLRTIVLGDAIEAELSEGKTTTAGGTWGFYLKEIDSDSTRLIIRIRWTRTPGLLNWLGTYGFLEPAHFVMERKMMLGIKQRAEALAKERASHGAADSGGRTMAASTK